MNNVMLDAKIQLEKIIKLAIEKAINNGGLPNEKITNFLIEVPCDTSHGDFASNVAMVSAKIFRSAPIKIAQTILENIDLSDTYFEKCEIAGPGFMNFFVSKDWFSKTLNAVLEDKENYGRSDFGQGKSVLVEFVSANPTGPMHIGNARGGAIGDCLTSVLDWAGYKVSREFYINDSGNQINKFALSLDIRYQQIYKDGIQMPEDSYKGQDIIEHANNFAKIYGDKYIKTTEQERRQALVEYALPLNIQGLERDLEKYRIKYDNWFRESTLHNNGKAKEIIKLLTQKGYTYEKEGAIWFDGSKYGCGDFVLVRSNGILTYVVPDIAYHYNKLVERNFDKAINVLGADHHGYVPRLKATLQALDVDPDRLDVVLMQMVRLIRDGEIVKASKRSGKAITLVTLLDEVPIDAARFFFNLREANSQMDFDLDLAVEKSSENPVYYVQYAYARICSIIKKLSQEGVDINKIEDFKFELLTNNEEREVIRHISSLPNEIIESAKSYDSARITRYSINLAMLFHKFYNACHVNVSDKDLMQARLGLCVVVKQVLGNVLSLLKITTPESM